MKALMRTGAIGILSKAGAFLKATLSGLLQIEKMVKAK